MPSHAPAAFPQSAFDRPWAAHIAMKARIIITPKKAVLDPQGKTVQGALAHLGCKHVTAVHVGKFIEIEIDPAADPAAARAAIDDACRRFLSNPVIEEYRLEVV